MVLSFHPNFVAHRNILCAGRLPTREDEAAISEADAIILPQGPSEPLYRLCRRYCAHVFPNYDVRFDYPGKLGQTRFFQQLHAPFPITLCFDDVNAFRVKHPNQCPLAFPCILKSSWGGEGDHVYLGDTPSALTNGLERLEKLETAGQKGFLLQEVIDHGGRSLRVVIIGKQLCSYWRQQADRSQIWTNIKSGAVIDHTSDPDLQEAGRQAVQKICLSTGINLAGFDLLFPASKDQSHPLFLEINYFFGRRGLGGSEKYYSLLDSAIRKWLEEIRISL